MPLRPPSVWTAVWLGVGVTIFVGAVVLLPGWGERVALPGTILGAGIIVIALVQHFRSHRREPSTHRSGDAASGPSVRQRTLQRLIAEGDALVQKVALTPVAPTTVTAIALQDWIRRAATYLESIDIYERTEGNWKTAPTPAAKAGRLLAALREMETYPESR